MQSTCETHDPKCKTCAYRVFERRWVASYATVTMVCLHPQVGKKDCRNARLSPGAKCGPEAELWRPNEAMLRSRGNA